MDADPSLQQVVGGGAPPVAGVGLGEHLQIVHQRAHPRRHLFLFGAGQEADVLADRYRDPGHDDLAVTLVLQHLGQARGQGQQRLAAAGLAYQADEVDVGIHQQVEGEVLFPVAGRDAPDAVIGLAVVLGQFKHHAVRTDLVHQRFEAAPALHEHALVGQQFGQLRAAQPVEGSAFLLPGLEMVAVGVPETGIELGQPAVEQVDVFEDLVVVVVLGAQAEDGSLDAQIDVLGHQCDRCARAFLLQRQRGAEDVVVRLVAGQCGRQFILHAAGLQVEGAAGGQGACVLDALHCQRDAGGDVIGRGAPGEVIQKAVHLAHVAGDLGSALLGVVQLLQHGHGQEYAMFLEPEQGGGVMHQHVGVEHEQALFGHAGGPFRPCRGRPCSDP